MNSSVRSKIEKFIDSHGAELVNKVNRKRKHQSSSSTLKEKTASPSSVISEDISKYAKSTSSFVQQPSQLSPPLPTPQSQPPSDDIPTLNYGNWNYDDDTIPTSPALKKRALPAYPEDDDVSMETKPIETSYVSSRSDIPIVLTPTSSDKPSHTSIKDDGHDYSRRNRADSPYSSSRDKLYSESSRYSSGSAGEYVRPGYVRPAHYNSYSSPSYYRYPPSSSGSYYRSSNPRYYSGGGGGSRRSSPPYYHRPSASSSRRGSLSDDEMDRRRWD